MPTTSSEVIEKVQKLVALASDKGAAEEEARSAALQAVRLMGDNDLTVVPKGDLESVQKSVEGMRIELREARKRETAKMLIGGAIGFGLAKMAKGGKLF